MSLVSLFVVLVAGLSSPYQWPLALPRELTSSFAEYRPGRFHAGIDLRTGGVGKAVRAAGDGYVSRIRCSPWGYGKAVYLQLADGHTVVYGHLDDYNDALRDYVRKAQHKAQSYTVDKTLKPGEFPVKKGDLIAKSGQTGIGAPHLHYEFRDAMQQPINPRLLGVSWPDKIAPRLKQILVSPGDAASSVDGDLIPKVLPLKKGADGLYYCAPIRAQGKIGIALDLVDEHAGSRLGIYQMRLLDGGQEVFRMQHDTLSYENHRNAAVAYHPFYASQGKFLTLWRWTGNVCASYQHSPGTGWYLLPDTPRPLTVEVTDFMGNSARFILRLEREAPALPPVLEDKQAASGSASLDCYGEYLVVTARFQGSEGTAPGLEIEHAGETVTEDLRRVGEGLFRYRFTPDKTGAYDLRLNHPRLPEWSRSLWAVMRGAGATSISLGDLRAKVPSDSPYGALYLRAYTVSKRPKAPLPVLGKCYRIWPAESPIDTPISLSFPVPAGAEDPTRLQVYRYRGSYWASEDTVREGNRLVIQSRNLGTFMVMEDTKAPVLRVSTPPENYHAQTRRPLIRASLSEIGSGVASIEGRCGSQWLLMEYDPERNALEWERDADLPPGKQEIRLRVVDEVGNSTVITRTVHIPAA